MTVEDRLLAERNRQGACYISLDHVTFLSDLYLYTARPASPGRAVHVGEVQKWWGGDRPSAARRLQQSRYDEPLGPARGTAVNSTVPVPHFVVCRADRLHRERGF